MLPHFLWRDLEDVLSFLPAICRHLFGQDLLLPSVPTYWCGDPAQRQAAMDRFEDMVVKPLYPGPKRSTWFVDQLTLEQKEKLLARIRAKPQLYLAQERIRLGTAPCFFTDRLEARPLVVRGFLAAVDDAYAVMPGGLARVSADIDSCEVTGQEGGISKDTWIISSEPAAWAAGHDAQAAAQHAARAPQGAAASDTTVLRLNRQQGPLPGYAAENLFWMGRYQERLEFQVRTWRGLLVRLEETPFEPGAAEAASEWPRLIRIFQPGFQDSDLVGAGLEAESIAVGPVRRFIQMGRCLERALCTARMLGGSLGRNLKPSDELMNALLAFHDSELTYRQRYQREVQAGALADLLVADEMNPRSIGHQLARFAEELTHLPLGDSSLLSACQKTILKALTSVRVFEPGDQGGILGPGGNEAFEHLMSSLETWLNHVSDLLAREFFQTAAAPQSMREWT